MQAIRINPENVETILKTGKSIEEFDMKQVLEDVAEKPYYFVPEWNGSTNYTGWAMIPIHVLQEYEYDANKVESEFVDITKKKEGV